MMVEYTPCNLSFSLEGQFPDEESALKTAEEMKLLYGDSCSFNFSDGPDNLWTIHFVLGCTRSNGGLCLKRQVFINTGKILDSDLQGLTGSCEEKYPDIELL